MTDRGRLDAIRERQEAANGCVYSNWKADYPAMSDPDDIRWGVMDDHGVVVVQSFAEEICVWIAHAREDVPYLLGRVTELETALSEAIELLREYGGPAQDIHGKVPAFLRRVLGVAEVD